jgi:hypothetical protein
MPEANRWALLVGINRYPRLAERYQLEGCVEDVRALSQVLVERHAFPPSHVVELLDEAATRSGILGAMEDLLQRVGGEGDTVLFHYSGHGSQQRDLDGDEADGMDETLVPSDSGRTGTDPNLDIVDDEIHAWLLRLAEKTKNVTLLFDCCHSGTVSRDFMTCDASTRVRRVEPDLRKQGGTGSTAARRGAVEGREPKGWLPGDLPHVALSACLPEETSHEVQLGEGGPSHGVLSWFLARALGQAAPSTTWRDLFATVASQVTDFYANQHPQLEGNADRRLFELEAAPAAAVPLP